MLILLLLFLCLPHYFSLLQAYYCFNVSLDRQISELVIVLLNIITISKWATAELKTIANGTHMKCWPFSLFFLPLFLSFWKKEASNVQLGMTC